MHFKWDLSLKKRLLPGLRSFDRPLYPRSSLLFPAFGLSFWPLGL